MGATSRAMCNKIGISKFTMNGNLKNPNKFKVKKIDLAQLIPVKIGKTVFYCKDQEHAQKVMRKYYDLLTKPQLKQLAK